MAINWYSLFEVKFLLSWLCSPPKKRSGCLKKIINNLELLNLQKFELPKWFSLNSVRPRIWEKCNTIIWPQWPPVNCVEVLFLVRGHTAKLIIVHSTCQVRWRLGRRLQGRKYGESRGKMGEKSTWEIWLDYQTWSQWRLRRSLGQCHPRVFAVKEQVLQKQNPGRKKTQFAFKVNISNMQMWFNGLGVLRVRNYLQLTVIYCTCHPQMDSIWQHFEVWAGGVTNVWSHFTSSL